MRKQFIPVSQSVLFFSFFLSFSPNVYGTATACGALRQKCGLRQTSGVILEETRSLANLMHSSDFNYRMTPRLSEPDFFSSFRL